MRQSEPIARWGELRQKWLYSCALENGGNLAKAKDSLSVHLFPDDLSVGSNSVKTSPALWLVKLRAEPDALGGVFLS